MSSKDTRYNFAAFVALTALNLSIAWRLLKIEYINQLASVDGLFIGIARYISTHWGDFSWFPIWHCGMPYQDTYVPMLHLVVAAVSSLGHVSAARAYHIVVAVTYSLGPAALYWMAVRLGASRGAAFLSALFYSLFSPSLLMMADMAKDAGGIWYSRRLQVMTVYGEGPHVTAMTLMPVVIVALQNALVKRDSRAIALAALAIAVVFLTNIPGSMALGVAVFCWICAQPRDRLRAAWAIAAGASVLAYCAACFGVPPSSMFRVGVNVSNMHRGFGNSLRYGPLPLALALGTIALAGYLLARTRLPLIVRYAILFSALVGPMAATADVEVYELLPQAGRLHLDFEIGACLLLGCATWAIYKLMPGSLWPVALALLIGAIAAQYPHYRWRAKFDTQRADLEKRSEYTTARWLDGHMNGGRVYATGSTAFWLNAFSATPQLNGCCDQGQSMAVLNEVPYKVNSTEGNNSTEAGINWLRALGVQAMVVNGIESTDEYKDIRLPQRFEAALPLLHRENGDSIYGVLPIGTSLAHVVRPADLVPVHVPPKFEYPDILRYAQATMDSARPTAEFTWLRSSHARVRANLRADDLVSVQVAWFPGWKATVSGAPRQVYEDGMGFLVVRPQCTGDCEIDLAWTGRGDLALTAVLSLLALGLLGAMIYLRRPLPYLYIMACNNEPNAGLSTAPAAGKLN
ncbi:MAG: hypothetical protein JWP63_1336 [Candidatus Solibacter sp.]|nr:hypothetical protein [Candidatus Solibacter sp.]